MTRLEFTEAMSVLCQIHACSVTSWWRTRQRNTSVGGAATSKHLTGVAVDLVPDDNVASVRERIVHDAHRLGLWAVDETDHVHIQGEPPTVAGSP